MHSQSKCFFFGPISSSVVALHTDLAKPCPAKLCRAANSLSCIVWPAIANDSSSISAARLSLSLLFNRQINCLPRWVLMSQIEKKL